LTRATSSSPIRERDGFGRWIERHAERSGSRLALVDDERRLDFAALHERILRAADVLRAAGVAPGERIALVAGNRCATLEATFAAARLGAISVPINARLVPREIRFLLSDCSPRALLCEDALEPRVRAALEGLPGAPPAILRCGGPGDPWERALAAARPLEPCEPAPPERPMQILYTSGTTGRPKGALLPERKTLANSRNAELFFGLSRDDRVLVALPLFHSFGLNILSLPTLYAGGTVVLRRGFDPAAVWEDVGREGITFFGGVPTMFRGLLDALEAASARFDLRSLRFLFTAGAAIPVELIRAFEARGLVLKQGFGQTETSILCCLDARDAIRKAGSVGRPVALAELRIVRVESLAEPPERWRDARPGEPGEIVVRGPIAMLGYWNRPEETAEVLRGGWLRTGDLATADDEGFVTLVGRARDMYISGGENVYPAEVEAVYSEHPAVREIAVVGRPDPKWGEVGRAYVVPAPGCALDAEALLAWGRERLAAFKLPRDFVSVPALPRTETGKVQKHRLGR
jgi:fatty-acyl-CoA synthase